MSRNGVGTCWLTTRIISSGVTPLATSGGDERAGARADVDVELVDGAVDRQQVERAQRADLVDAAGEAAAAEHQRRLRAALAGAAGSGLRSPAVARPCAAVSSLTTLPMPEAYCTARRSEPFPQTDAGCASLRSVRRSVPSLACAVLDALMRCAVGASGAVPGAAPAARAVDGSALQRVRSTRACRRRRRGAQPAALRRRPDHRQHAVSTRTATSRALPASVEKLFTTATALLRFGPTATLDDTVLGDGHARRAAALAAATSTSGGGDPTFGSASFDRSPTAAAPRCSAWSRTIRTRASARSRARRRRRVATSTSLRGSSGHRLSASRPTSRASLSALVFDRGSSTGARVRPRPALFAAQQFVRRCAAPGVQGRRQHAATGTDAAGGPPLATVDSPPIATLMRADQHAVGQLLRRDAAQGPRRRASAAAARRRPGAAVVRRTLARRSASARGSSTARASRARPARRPRQVVSAARRDAPVDAVERLRRSLAVAGETGTLARRDARHRAAGRCRPRPARSTTSRAGGLLQAARRAT